MFVKYENIFERLVTVRSIGNMLIKILIDFVKTIIKNLLNKL